MHSPAEKLDTPCHIKTVWTWAWAQVWDWVQPYTSGLQWRNCFWCLLLILSKVRRSWAIHQQSKQRGTHLFQGISFYTIPAKRTKKMLNIKWRNGCLTENGAEGPSFPREETTAMYHTSMLSCLLGDNLLAWKYSRRHAKACVLLNSMTNEKVSIFLDGLYIQDCNRVWFIQIETTKKEIIVKHSQQICHENGLIKKIATICKFCRLPVWG